MLVKNRARLEELRRRGEGPALVPAVVLAEALTGNHRRDFHENRLLRTCDVHTIDESISRSAAALRTAVGGTRPPSAVDAIVVALADHVGGAAVLTGDLRGPSGPGTTCRARDPGGSYLRSTLAYTLLAAPWGR